ncbi:MAG: glycosyltransferase [Gemmatimonadota bacterium]
MLESSEVVGPGCRGGARRWLRPLYWVSVAIVIVVVAYRGYLELSESELASAHATQVREIQDRLAGRESFRFAVVGNVNNSIGVFERQIIPRLNASGVDFVVSAGNAVTDGGADKYRALRGTLARLEVPYLLAFGEHEASRFGSSRFYREFGPFFFAFSAGDARFIFMDSSGETSYAWQLQWLEEELEAGSATRTFIVTGKPVFRPDREPFFVEEEDYLGPPWFRQALLGLLDRHDIDAVFAAHLPVFDHQVRGGTHHVTTGGAGGLAVRNEESFHHFVMVDVTADGISLEARPLDVGQPAALRTLESLWFFVHSLFFVGYPNFLLIVALLVALAVKLHGLVFVDRDYYPRFDVDASPYLDAPLRVAMFTNNYLPFLGGVPISIDRLRRGLVARGREVLVVAPDYGRVDRGTGGSGEQGVLRVPTLLSFAQGTFQLANPFLPRIALAVKRFRPDVIHLHHPFWIGSLGLWLARRLDVPAIYTYHTRLEHYAHYVPLPGRLFRNLISHFLIRRFANKCFGVVVPTVAAREYLRTIGVRSRMLVQPTGIDFTRFQEVNRDDVAALRERLGLGDDPVLLSVSRISAEKNIDFIVEAVAELAELMDSPFRLVLVGDGDGRASASQLAHALGIGDRLVMPGAVAPEDLPVYYGLADVFVFASTTETQGMVVLEAMAAGLPVVAVRASGIDDFVQDGITGYKTRPDRTEWAHRVRSVLTDGERRESMGRAAREVAREHDIDRFSGEIAAFHAEAVAHHRAPPRRSPQRSPA